MLTYSNNNLTGNIILSATNNTLKLKTDTQVNYLGILQLKDNIVKTVQFVDYNDMYIAKLNFYEEDITHLANELDFYLVMAEPTGTKQTNKTKVKLDINKIRLNIKSKSSHAISDLYTQINQLDRLVNGLLKPTVISGINILEGNYVQPGMVPMTIDTKGSCMFQFPFADVIKEINSLKTSDGKITLHAENIPVTSETSVAKALTDHTTALKSLNSSIQTMSKTFETLSLKVAEIEKKLLEHIDASIV